MFQEDLKEHFNDVKEEFENYVDKRIDLIKLHIVEEMSRFFSRFAVKLGVLYLLFFGIMFISLAAAIFLSELFESFTIGFSLVSVFYLLAAWLFYLLRKRFVEKPVINTFIKLFFPKFDQDEE